MKKLFISILILALWGSAFAAEPAKPAPGDKCPVCGMFVAKFPDFLARVDFKDGSYAVFDGPKDMFKYLLNLQKYSPAKKPVDIESVFVTDYYSLRMIDGRKAFYVVGSNVTGPMGRELIPFEKAEEAAEFMTDHAGQSRLPFNEVTGDILKGLD